MNKNVFKISFKLTNNIFLYKVHENLTANNLRTYRKISTNQISNGADYCINLVKNHDYENFMCTLLLKGDQRRGTFAVRAFNVEVSKIMSAVSDDKIGTMRLKFWDDAIGKLYNKENPPIPEHPVVKELKMCIDKNRLTKRFFQRLIFARNRPSNLGFLTVKDVEDYCENTVSSVFYLLMEIHGIKNVHADHAASHLGKAQGMVNMLRSIPYLKRSIALPIPQEILIKHGVSQERIIRNSENDKGVQDCIFDVATIAHQHLEKSRNLRKTTPKESRIVLLPAVATARYLEKLRQVKFHLTHKALLSRDSMLPLAYFKHKFLGKY